MTSAPLIPGSFVAEMPLRIGSEADFEVARDFFQKAGFNDQNVCHAAGIEDIAELGGARWEARDLNSYPPMLRWCVEVFLRGLKASESDARSVCGEKTLAALRNLGLIRESRKEAQAVVSPVWVYPADGFVMVSDRRDDPEGGTFAPPADVVFPAIYPGTLRFLRLLPDIPGAEALDLCGGSGIGALRLSRSARQALTADITERSAFFADFNARLNGAPARSLRGDLYEPVAGRQFDLITAHPPFVPAIGDNMVYRDGGATGEEITRRIIEGLPAHLRAGGMAIVLGVVRDTEQQPFERRAFEWLGTGRDQFDVIFGLEKILAVQEVVDSMRKRGQNFGEAQAAELRERLRSFATKQFVYGALVARRYGEKIGQQPARVRMAPSASATDFQRLLDWRAHCRQPGLQTWLANSSPRMAPELELTARHTVRNGELVPAEFVFSTENSFPAALRIDGWAVPLVARMDGKRSVTELFEQAQKDNELPKGFGLEAFTDLIRMMIERGFLKR